MEDIYKILHEGFEFGHTEITENDKRFAKVEANLNSFLLRAKETLAQKNMNPKPLKRFMRTIQDESEDESEVPERSESRPLRNAKSKANLNLKEAPMNVKMRNDNNLVSIKTERSSTLSKSSSRDSVKENQTPNEGANAKRRSPDEEIQLAAETEAPAPVTAKRSNSVEFISAKLVEIDITEEESSQMLPPKKVTKKTRNKKKQTTEEPEVNPLRITRSKIKQEKVSIDSSVTPQPFASVSQINGSNASIASSNASKKGGKKKCPMPILIKLEPEDKKTASEDDVPLSELRSAAVATNACDETFDVPPPAVNETVTIAPAINETVTLSRNPHDSLMTEDNDDEDVPMEEAPPLLPKKQLLPPPVPLKLKKNEVFNPYLSSPVKQRVQAFENHAQGSTPGKYNTMPPKYSVLKNGTPSKIALYSKTTPLNKGLKTSASTTAVNTASTSGQKTLKPTKKMNSLSQESLDELKRSQQVNSMTVLLEEKRKAREEKQRQAQILREAIEKEKREQVLKQQMERDEKYRKIMKEKEEKQRMEALKKKMLKENQAKKYAEEKAKKDFIVPKPVEPSSAKMNDSLHLKMQKQIMIEKTAQQKKAESKNVYSFDMLHTDDSTDDESRPSQKRPPQPEWSKKQKRKPLIVMQSHINHNVLDSLFSVQPISVDLREIFPAIDSRKLIRNSSAIWRTPPKHY